VALPGVASEAAEECDQMVRVVFLDRDGVINANLERDGKPVAPRSLAEFRILPGVEDAVDRLKSAGYLLIVVTNQPDVAKGLVDRVEVEAMHAEIRRRLPVNDIIVCYHVDADNCLCRKPKPGMLLVAAAKYEIDLPRSYIVGDRWRDVEAGRRAGCTTIFVDYGYPQESASQPHKVASSLSQAADFILAEH
jgi:D-glycero-D-manno-heptose 1,7-bisphosphate phosphatase